MAQLMLSVPNVPRSNVRQGIVLPKMFDPIPDQVQIFQIDRSTLVLQLQSLRRAIEQGAEEMEMVAAEKVFVRSVSRALTRRARKLYLAAKDLNRLVRMVEQAHPERRPPRPTPRNGRKPRN
jgi:hypothetical protein